jgi:ABC-2 type transport system permease protein
MSTSRLLYWSIRREMWENRSLYLAPLIVAAVVLFGTFIHTTGMSKKMRAAAGDPAKQYSVIAKPFSMAPAPIMLATFLVGFFYAIDALYGERRDRSILFWKSLPVSDRMTVLSKMSVPVIVLPLIAWVLSVVTVFILLFTTTGILLASGTSPGPLWRELHLFEQVGVMFYGLAVHALWFSPIYAWLLLVSVWARRTPILWAVLPLFAIGALEKMAFNSTHIAAFMKYRAMGAMTLAFTHPAGSTGDIDRLWQLTPARFLSSAGLWLGLLFVAACLAAAVRLRRRREPI